MHDCGPVACAALEVCTPPVSFGTSCVTLSLYLSDGGGQSQPLQSLRPNDPRNLLFTGQNAEAQLRFVFTLP